MMKNNKSSTSSKRIKKMHNNSKTSNGIMVVQDASLHLHLSGKDILIQIWDYLKWKKHLDMIFNNFKHISVKSKYNISQVKIKNEHWQ